MRAVAVSTFLMAVVCALPAFGQAPPAHPVEDNALCVSCHTTESPAPGAPALKPCPRPKETADPTHVNGHAVTEARDIVIIDKLADLYVPVVFSHKLHASMTNMSDQGCQLCHHYTEDKDIVACESCHGVKADPNNLRQPGLKGAYHRQCLACHREWSHENGCVFCHAKHQPGAPVPSAESDPTDIVGMLHPRIEVPDTKIYKVDGMEEGPIVSFQHKEHVEAFGLKCVECHQRENCSNCHDMQKKVDHHETMMSDPHNETCGNCHEQEVADKCTFCHKTEENGHFNHAKRSSFVLKPHHAALQCRQCHKNDEKRFTKVSNDCTTCHGADWPGEGFDHGHTGVVLDETHKEIACADCHADGIGKRVRCDACHGLDWEPAEFDHRRTGEPLDEIHKEIACADCHGEGLEKPATCNACHDDGRTSMRASMTREQIVAAFAPTPAEAPPAEPATAQ